MTIPLDNDKTYSLRLGTGCLRISAAADPDYPGLDVEFIPDDDNLKDNQTHARVLIEQTANVSEKSAYDPVRILVWNDENEEDYTREIEFTKTQSGT